MAHLARCRREKGWAGLVAGMAMGLAFLLVAAGWPAGAAITVPGQPTGVTAAHRDGQTFITWTENPAAGAYRVYRHAEPITAANLGQAQLVADVPQGSAYYRHEDAGCQAPPCSPVGQSRFVIDDSEGPGLGAELPAGTGLLVHTVPEPGTWYYAVTSLAAGEENRAQFGAGNTARCQEAVAPPGAVRAWQNSDGTGAVYTHWMDRAAWNLDFEGHAYNFYVGVPAGYAASTADYPLVVDLHGWGDHYWLVDETDPANDGGSAWGWPVIYVIPDDRSATWWYGFGDWLTAPGDPPPAGARVVNYTEQRLLSAIAFVLRTYRADENRVYLFGSSMGGTGAMHLGLRHPEIFAAVYSNAGMTNIGASDTWRSDGESKWGPLAANLPTNEGPGVWDRTDLLARASELPDPPFLGWSHGTLDTVVEWASQGQPAPGAFQVARLGWTGAWEAYDHTWPGFLAAQSFEWEGVPNPNFSFQRFDLPRDESYPAFSNASCSADPTQAPAGSVNLCLQWSSSVNDFAGPPLDTASRYEIVIQTRPDLAASAVVDVTPRRLQQFVATPGAAYDWQTRRLSDQALAAGGRVVADAWGRITVPGVAVEPGGIRLSLVPAGAPAPRAWVYLPLILKESPPGPTPPPTPGVVRPLADTSDGIHVFNDQLAGLSDAQVAFAASHYAGTQKLTRSDADRLRAYNPDLVVLHYRLGLGLGYRAIEPPCSPTGPWIDVVEGDAWVREWPADPQDSWFFQWQGRRVLNCDWGWYLVDPGDAAWRSYWTGEIQRQLQANDDDGLFADSFSVPNYLGADRYDPALPALDPAFELAWTERLNGLLAHVQQGELAPYYFIPNAGQWVTSRDAVDYALADGVMLEGFAAWGPGSPFDLADWQLQMERVLGLVALDRAILAQQYVDPDNVNERLFVLGCYLLVKGRYTYLNLDLGLEPEWFPEYDIAIGQPAGDLRPASLDSLWVEPWGLYARRYSHGWVLVNPTATARTVTLDGTYYRASPSGGGLVPEDADLSAWTVTYTPVTSLTLAPNRAAILLNEVP